MVLLSVIVASFVLCSSALQLLRATRLPSVGSFASGVAFGVDFTARSAIDVSAIGVLDADARGFNGTTTAHIVDRSSGLVVAGPVAVQASEARTDDANPFVFQALAPAVRLPPGVYSVMTVGAGDGYLGTLLAPGSVVAGDSGDDAVLITAAVSSGNGRIPSQHHAGHLLAGATLLFAAVRPAAWFADCEAVACANLSSGEYNIRGETHFCDNDAAGGGWLRLWLANESACEQQGWSSARNPSAVGLDPVGCRATAAATGCAGTRVSAPFQFAEVRGGNWLAWGVGALSAFESTALVDGIVIKSGGGDNDSALVWVLATGSSETPCPCEYSPRVNSTIGSHWTCDRVAAQQAFAWAPLFRAESSNIACTGDAATNVSWFQRRLDAPQQTLSVEICRDQPEGIKDVKLSSGELYVRTTAGFDKARHCTAAPTSDDGGGLAERDRQVLEAAAAAAAIGCLFMSGVLLVLSSSKSFGGKRPHCCS